MVESGELDEDAPMIKIYKPRSNWHIRHFKGLQDIVAIPDRSEAGDRERERDREDSSSQTMTPLTDSKVATAPKTQTLAPKTFPFLSEEMQEKYVDAMKQFNEAPSEKGTVKESV